MYLSILAKPSLVTPTFYFCYQFCWMSPLYPKVCKLYCILDGLHCRRVVPPIVNKKIVTQYYRTMQVIWSACLPIFLLNNNYKYFRHYQTGTNVLPQYVWQFNGYVKLKMSILTSNLNPK